MSEKMFSLTKDFRSIEKNCEALFHFFIIQINIFYKGIKVHLWLNLLQDRYVQYL